MRKSIIKTILLISTFMLFVWLFSSCTPHQNEAEEIETINIGDEVTFGIYEQDNNISNGKEDIVWIVLDKKEDKILLFSKYCLNIRKYDAEHNSGMTWESSDIRKWLNGDFMDSAFTVEQMETIVYQTLINADSEKYGTDGGNRTIDQVFLLSENEITQYIPSREDRRATPTEYAKAQTTYSLTGATGYCRYWLRSPGKNYNYPSTINNFGDVEGELILAHNNYISIRPAVWVYYSENSR